MCWSWDNIDWAATGTWAQLLAAIIGLRVAWTISRAELVAQRKTAAEAQSQFNDLVWGLCKQAVEAIVDAANTLNNDDAVKTIAHGYAPTPSTAAHVNALKALDLNRMPSGHVALAVMEIRRLSGWTKGYASAAFNSMAEYDVVEPEVSDRLIEWRDRALAELQTLEAALLAAKR